VAGWRPERCPQPNATALDAIFHGKGCAAKGEDACRTLLAWAGLAPSDSRVGDQAPAMAAVKAGLLAAAGHLFTELPGGASYCSATTLEHLRGPLGTRLAANMRVMLAHVPRRLLLLPERIVAAALALAGAPSMPPAARLRFARGAIAALLDPIRPDVWDAAAWELGADSGIVPLFKGSPSAAARRAISAVKAAVQELRALLERRAPGGQAAVLQWLNEGAQTVPVGKPNAAQAAVEQVLAEAQAGEGDDCDGGGSEEDVLGYGGDEVRDGALGGGHLIVCSHLTSPGSWGEAGEPAAGEDIRARRPPHSRFQPRSHGGLPF
jgi:hypothetical protein